MLNRNRLFLPVCATFGALTVAIFAYGEEPDLAPGVADSTGASRPPLAVPLVAAPCAVGIVAIGVGFFAGGPDSDEVTGGPQNDILSGAECDDILGGAGGDDVLDGNSGDDDLNGGGGDDKLRGGFGSDTLVGSIGNDVLSGGPGNDVLDGAEGDDLLVGGPGVDVIDGKQGCDICIGDPNDQFFNCEVIIVNGLLTTPAGTTCPNAPQPEAFEDFLNE